MLRLKFDPEIEMETGTGKIYTYTKSFLNYMNYKRGYYHKFFLFWNYYDMKIVWVLCSKKFAQHLTIFLS